MIPTNFFSTSTSIQILRDHDELATKQILTKVRLSKIPIGTDEISISESTRSSEYTSRNILRKIENGEEV